MSEDEKAALQEQARAMHVVHTVWHAAEQFCLAAVLAPSAALAPRVLAWLQMNVADAEADARDASALARAVDPRQHAAFWPLVRRRIACGGARDVAALLALPGDDANDNDARLRQTVCALLERMPDAAATRTQWRQWQADCAAVRDASASLRSADADAPLARLLSVLCGDSDVIEADFEGYDRLGALLAFAVRDATPRDVVTHARRCLAGRETPLDDLLVLLLSGDAHGALSRLESPEAPSGWLHAHLVDLLWHAGALESHALLDAVAAGNDSDATGNDSDMSGDGATRVRRAHLLRYVDALDAAGARCDWSLHSSYWAACGRDGAARARLRLASAPLGSTRAAARVLSACARLEPTLGDAVARDVRVAMGTRALRQGRGGDAVRWLSAAGDDALLDAAAATLLEQYTAAPRHRASAAASTASHVDAVLATLDDNYVFSPAVALLS